MASLTHEAHYVPADGRPRQVWCTCPTRDDVYRFLISVSQQLAGGRLELAVVERLDDPLPPFAETPKGNRTRYALLGTGLRPWR